MRKLPKLVSKLSVKHLRKHAKSIKVSANLEGKSMKDAPFVRRKMEMANKMIAESGLPDINDYQ